MHCCVSYFVCVSPHSTTRFEPSSTFQVVALCFCACMSVWVLGRWYFDMWAVYCARVSVAPSAQRFLAHLCDPIMTGKLDTGEDIPLASSSGCVTRLHKHAAPAIPVTWSGGVMTAQTLPTSHSPALWDLHIESPARYKLLTVEFKPKSTEVQMYEHVFTHPYTPLTRTALMNTLITERTGKWLAQGKHYTSTFRHMACGPTDGHTHMVLVASAASHGRKALSSPLIRLQISEHSTQSTAWKSLTVWVASFCLIIEKN